MGAWFDPKWAHHLNPEVTLLQGFVLYMNCCYIIFSKKLNRFYIGVCQDNLNERILKHNHHTYGNHRFTAKADDWTLFLSIECESYSQAVKIEKHIKAMKSSLYIKNLIKYPDIIIKLKEKHHD